MYRYVTTRATFANVHQLARKVAAASGDLEGGDMKGDIAFAGFVLTATEWQALDTEARSQLIAVATRRSDLWLAPAVCEAEPLADGSGPLECEELGDLDLEPVQEGEA
jgi:hypothetical protein